MGGFANSIYSYSESDRCSLRDVTTGFGSRRFTLAPGPFPTAWAGERLSSLPLLYGERIQG
jgi:hypothetical protein